MPGFANLAAISSSTSQPEQINSTNNAAWNYIAQDYRGSYPEATIQNFAAVSVTAAAALTCTGVNALGWPFTSIVFTKSAAVESLTLRVTFNGRGVACVVISGLTGETIAITGILDGTNASAAITTKTTAGVAAAASALGNGTYWLVVP